MSNSGPIAAFLAAQFAAAFSCLFDSHKSLPKGLKEVSPITIHPTQLTGIDITW